MQRNLVILVDENDQAIGQEDKLVAHQKGLLHRAFSVFIVRKYHNEIQLLMQQRAATKYHGALLWSNSCCSHPQPNEDIQLSALKRVEEELGVSLNEITPVGSHLYKAMMPNDLIEHEFDHLFISRENPKTNCFNPEEVQRLQWQSLPDLEQQLLTSPESFTPWFLPTLEKIKPFI